jgi:subtilisin family serine protease
LIHAPFADRTGDGVLVAVVDSGIHAGHPHVGAVKSGICLFPGGDEGDSVDRIGHGTAVSAAIREKSPGAELLAVRVFDRQLATNAAVLAKAIDWSADAGARLINLSLGTANAAHRDLLGGAVERAKRAGAIVVSARQAGAVNWLPGSLPSVAAVEVDWSLERDELEVAGSADETVFRATGYPRPIPGVPRERNLSGISFAVANVTGFLARLLEDRDVRSVRDILNALGAESYM